jgi:hypothetical protein
MCGKHRTLNPVFLEVWQGKGLQEKIPGCVVKKGVKGKKGGKESGNAWLKGRGCFRVCAPRDEKRVDSWLRIANHVSTYVKVCQVCT